MQFFSTFIISALSACSLVVAAPAAPTTNPKKYQPRAAVCASTCNNAYIEYQLVGQVYACFHDPSFIEDQEACLECEIANDGDAYADYPQDMGLC